LRARRKKKDASAGLRIEGTDCAGSDLARFGEPIDDITANRKAQEEVEKAFLKWGRYRLALDTDQADLVVGVRKGTGKIANPTIRGGPGRFAPRDD